MGQQGFDWAVPAAPTPCLRQWPPALGGLAPDWQETVHAFWSDPVGQALSARIAQALAGQAVIYPPEPLRALALTALADVRVVILGQDPYHGPGQAEGLAFSVASGVKVPPSLRNIFRELQRSLGLPVPAGGSLVRWARQGVLLLNTSLTVEEGQAASHARWGWEALTDRLVTRVAARAEPVVFMLWGAHAQAKQALIDAAAPDERHLVLQANHPSPLSALRPPRPFLGCDHFTQANAFLARTGQKPIDW
ncbi:MAG: uracil-DNA glycosylase [Limnohabitans sp.]|jgi:uracil-DNA glycosylase